MRLDLLVTLKTSDLVRETAWLALTGPLAWGDRLVGLTRHRLWRFTLAGAAAAGREDARRLLAAEIERSADFYNPNKERLSWADPDRLAEGETLPAPAPGWRRPPAAAALWSLGLWVTDEGGAAPLLARRTAAGLAAEGLALTALATGSLWELGLRAAGAEEARALAADLAVSRGRHEGLLLNPHYQEGRLLWAAPAPAADGPAR